MSDATNNVRESRFIKACRQEKTDCTPIWFMRQAGRYMQNYLDLRAKHTMLEVIGSPELSFEVTMQPIEAFDFDAAIIFSDILPLLTGFGFELDFVKGHGPKIANPLSDAKQVAKLGTPDATEIMASTIEAVTLVSDELNTRGLPLIGFAGAPFTLACYAIQGQGSKNYERAKAFMYSHPEQWHTFMQKIVAATTDYLIAQANAGASALQIFDSWAGLCSERDYIRFIKPHNTALFESLSHLNVPLINFSTGTSSYLSTVSEAGGDVVGVDWRKPLSVCKQAIGKHQAIQGNLDPTTLLAPWDELKTHVDAILDDAATIDGHIFNLGHGILPPTPIDNVRRVVDYVHERTAN